METGGGGILGRLGEKVLGWLALAALLGLGFAIYQMGPQARGAILDGAAKTLFWIVLCAALPWSSWFFIRRLLAFGTNWAGFALLAGFLLIEVLVGLYLLGGPPAGGWGWLASLAAVAVAGTYNFLVTEYLAEQYGN